MTYFTWITEKIAIGEWNASYEPFDTIVNLAYINQNVNELEHGKMDTEDHGGKTIYTLGVYDTDNDAFLFLSFLYRVVPLLSPTAVILFQCHDGKSRSVCMTLAYLCKFHDVSVDTGMTMIHTKRPNIHPRPSFVNMVMTWNDLRRA
jgi:hypothetical protein